MPNAAPVSNRHPTLLQEAHVLADLADPRRTLYTPLSTS
jgi:hypothetical protein